MIAEILVVLAGHSSSLFPEGSSILPAFAALLHPGEQQTLEALAQIAFRYRKIKTTCAKLSTTPSRYVCALCATLNHILRDEYEAVVIQTEAKVLRRDPEFVGRGSFVPLSSIRATFSEWDAPLATLVSMVDELEAENNWKPGPLIDMLLSRSCTGVYRVAAIFSRLAVAVQRTWQTQLTAFLVHGTLSPTDPLASADYVILEGAMPSCVSSQTRDSIAYVGRAIGTIKSAKWRHQLPRSLAAEHTVLLDSALPEDQHAFDQVVAQIRTNISEWLWHNVLTAKDVEESVDSLANYFLIRNGEFSLSLIREIERLKLSRLTTRPGSKSIIREQDLNLGILRASLGTTAQHDTALSRLRFTLPAGPLQPLLPSLAAIPSVNKSSVANHRTDFTDLLLGTTLILTYNVSWPLDLFLHPDDLHTYSMLHAFLSSLRKTHTRIHICWSSLSNAQRARRRWTGLSEGGTHEDLEARKILLRCSWGIVRDMGWFLDTLLGYMMQDVVDVEYRQLKKILGEKGVTQLISSQTSQPKQLSNTASTSSNPSQLDFTTLRKIHNMYLDRLMTGCLLSSPALTSILRSILELCDRFVAQIERWGGDVLPALLFEGSLYNSDQEVGIMVKERWSVVGEINKTLHLHLDAFYEQLSLSTSRQLFAAAEASKSILLNASIIHSFNNTSIRLATGLGDKDVNGGSEVRRHVERLLLRLDFSGRFSRPMLKSENQQDILREGGLA